MRLFNLAVVHQDWTRKLGRLMYMVLIYLLNLKVLANSLAERRGEMIKSYCFSVIVKSLTGPMSRIFFFLFFFFSCLNARLPLWADLVLLQLYIFLFKGMLEPWACVQICHSSQDQLWKLEVRRLLQWASNGRIMQRRSSGCPHYLAVVVMNGLKCALSKSEEKCDPSAKIQMVPLQGHCCRSQYTLFIMQWMFR